MQNNNVFFPELNKAIEDLATAKTKLDVLNSGLSIANEVMHILGIPYSELDQGEDELDKAFPSSKFRNQKMESWFAKHPYFGGGRLALYHYDKETYPIESKFYELVDTPRKERISATTQLFPNWEDSNLTMLPEYKVGIDFFLSPKTHSVLVVLSKKRNLRVMELVDHLTHTQIEIFQKVQNCVKDNTGIDPNTGKRLPFEPQKTIHKILWDAFELHEVNKQFYVGIADHFTLLCQGLRNCPPEGVSDIEQSSKIFSNRLIGRLLFVWFIRKKGIINEDPGYFDAGKMSSTDYYEKKLKPLFFKTLNVPLNERPFGSDMKTPYLNGGLFEAHPSDWPDKRIVFPEGWFVTLYEHLDKFNFTTDESSPEYEQVAIDPEMLGRVFENLLASIVPETSKAANERNNKGAFYTPREIVSYMCKISLKEYLKRHATSENDYAGIDKLIDLSDSEFLEQRSSGMSDLWGVRSQAVKTQLISSLNDIKIIDPACGSGAFPIGMMQLLIKTYDRLSAIYDSSLKKMRYMRPNEHNDIYSTKLFIIQNSLFGVDIEPMAVEIARLRAWLSLIIDDKKDVDPLPNLDFNFTCANTLVPLKNMVGEQLTLDDDSAEYEEKFNALRGQYFNAHSLSQKNELREEFRKFRKEVESSPSVFGGNEKKEQLASWNPFNSSKPAFFFDSKTMFNVEKFDIVIGNPPYINFNDIKEDSHAIYEPLKYKTYKATGDMYCLFIEKGINLLKDKGILTYITSNKWMRAGYGEALRDYLSKSSNPLLLIDFGGVKVFESATVDTDILQVAKESNAGMTKSCLIKDDSLENLSDYVQQHPTNISFKTATSWVIISDVEKRIKEKIIKYGTPLSQWNLSINYGIKTGLNDAFIIDQQTKEKLIAEDPRSAEIIRPILRGRDIKRFSYTFADQYLICTFPSKHICIDDYPAIKKHLLAFGIERLEQTGQEHIVNGVKIKSRKRTQNKWFETQDSIAYWDEFSKTKIIYPCIMRDGPHFMYDSEGKFFTPAPGNIITGEHLQYLIGFLCSNITYFALRKFYMGGGIEGELKTNRLLILPIPKFSGSETDKNIELLVMKINKEIEKNNNQLLSEIDSLVAEKYRLTDEEKSFISKEKYI